MRTAIGAMPTASATATTLLARAGIMLAREHRGEDEQRADAAEHEQEAQDLLLAELRDQLVGAHVPTSDGIEP